MKCWTGMTSLEVVRLTGKERHGDNYDESIDQGIPEGFERHLAELDAEIERVLEGVRHERVSRN